MEMAMNPLSNSPISMAPGFADNHRINKTPYVETGGEAQRDADPAAMESVVTALMAPGKGLFAADEGAPSSESRFHEIALVSIEEKRRAYREMEFTAPRLSDSISGVILLDETIHQRTSSGTTMPELLSSLGIIPGIKVDAGTVPLANCPGETMTQGLDGLRERLLVYRRSGAWFTTWRAVLSITDDIPSRGCIAANATQLALFAALSQEAGLVPIVEPDLLMHGNHGIDRCEEVTKVVLTRVFDALSVHGVDCTRLLLTTGMVLSGAECPEQAGIDQVAATTIRCLRDAVPASVPGILFLSGGQGEDQATDRLNAMYRTGATPWPMSFSFGRTLKSSGFKLWNGSPGNTATAQVELLRRAQQNSRAARGVADAAIAHR
jgi:fructose-bisphosphate aldolase class I